MWNDVVAEIAALYTSKHSGQVGNCSVRWRKKWIPPGEKNHMGLERAYSQIGSDPGKRIDGIEARIMGDLKRDFGKVFLGFSGKKKFRVLSSEREELHGMIFLQFLEEQGCVVCNSSPERIC